MVEAKIGKNVKGDWGRGQGARLRQASGGQSREQGGRQIVSN